MRPRPVLTSTGIAGLITSTAGVLAFLGYSAQASNLSSEATAIGATVIGAVTLGSHVLAGLHAQGKVTPTASPQHDDGTPLVKATATAAVSEPTVGPSTPSGVSSANAPAIDSGPPDAYDDEASNPAAAAATS